MKPGTQLAILTALLVPIVIGLQGWTLASVVDVRERVVRLETLAQPRPRPGDANAGRGLRLPQPQASEVPPPRLRAM